MKDLCSKLIGSSNKLIFVETRKTNIDIIMLQNKLNIHSPRTYLMFSDCRNFSNVRPMY